MTYGELFNLIKETEFNKAGDDVDYKVIVKDNTIYLLFEESNGKIDWKHNFAFTSKMYGNKDMICHHGFADAYRSAKEIIQKDLLTVCGTNNGCKVVIAGWSFGGAMAVLAAEDFNFRTKTESNPEGIKPTVITFGAPKVAARKRTMEHIRKAFADDSKQFAHKLDIVVHCPPFFWFKHIMSYKLGKVTFCNMWGIFNPQKYHTMYDEWTKDIIGDI